MATSIDNNDGESTKSTSQLLRNSTTTTAAGEIPTVSTVDGANIAPAVVAAATAVAAAVGTAAEGGDDNNKTNCGEQPPMVPDDNDEVTTATNNHDGGDDGATLVDAAASSAVKPTTEPSAPEEKWSWRRWGQLFLQSLWSHLVRLPALVLSILSQVTTAIPLSKLSSLPIIKILQGTLL
jgi:hypothetical protein